MTTREHGRIAEARYGVGATKHTPVPLYRHFFLLVWIVSITIFRWMYTRRGWRVVWLAWLSRPGRGDTKKVFQGSTVSITTLLIHSANIPIYTRGGYAR